jgi:hypothetical protein
VETSVCVRARPALCISAPCSNVCGRDRPALCDNVPYFHGWKCPRDEYGPIVWVKSLEEVVGALCFPFAPLGAPFYLRGVS